VRGKHSLMRACSRSHVGLDRGAGLPADTGASVASDQLSLVLDGTRFYEPQTGGFTTSVPAFSQTEQAYAYAGDNPVNNTDPTGLHVCNGNPLTWGGCAANLATSAVDSAIGSAVGPLIGQAQSDLATEAGTASGSGGDPCGSDSASDVTDLSQGASQRVGVPGKSILIGLGLIFRECGSLHLLRYSRR
jgi:RHS repeat-associated protein